jgi:hypothetical protein
VKQKAIWAVIFDAILSTDMSRHRTIYNAMASLQAQNDFDPETEPGHKVLLMQMVMKCADLGGIARPYDTARLRCKSIAEELFRQGELSGSAGIVYSTLESRRENVDKRKSLPGVLQNVCLPLFECLVKFCPQLAYLMDQVSKNVNQFQKMRG